jgi:hypothetical protein
MEELKKVAETMDKAFDLLAKAEKDLLGKIQNPDARKGINNIFSKLNLGRTNFDKTDPLELQQKLTDEFAKINSLL